jgi:hypothetical protein
VDVPNALVDELRSVTMSELVTGWEAQVISDVKKIHETDSGGSNWDVDKEGERSTTNTGFMDLPEQLVVALRDVAGLPWGAVDFGGRQNGDMMHFDCRTVPEAASIKELVKDSAKASKILEG